MEVDAVAKKEIFVARRRSEARRGELKTVSRKEGALAEAREVKWKERRQQTTPENQLSPAILFVTHAARPLRSHNMGNFQEQCKHNNKLRK